MDVIILSFYYLSINRHGSIDCLIDIIIIFFTHTWLMLIFFHLFFKLWKKIRRFVSVGRFHNMLNSLSTFDDYIIKYGFVFFSFVRLFVLYIYNWIEIFFFLQFIIIIIVHVRPGIPEFSINFVFSVYKGIFD